MTVARLFVALGLWAAVPLGASAQADQYPERPVTLVVPWPAGGFTDRLGRLVAEKMAASFGKPVIVENRPGASAQIGSEQVMRAAPDGHMLLVLSTDGVVKLMQGSTDPVSQFTHIGMLAAQPVTLSVGPKYKGNSLAQFVEDAKRNEGALAYASNGEGSATHYGMEIFAKQAGIRLNHIPYKGTTPALQDLAGGQIDATLVSLQGVGALLQSGRARALAITSAQRVAAAPNVPTFGELGYSGFDLQLWYGMSAPKGLAEPIVRKLNQVVRGALTAPDVQQALRSAAAEPIPGTPDEMVQFVKKEAARWGGIIK